MLDTFAIRIQIGKLFFKWSTQQQKKFEDFGDSFSLSTTEFLLDTTKQQTLLCDRDFDRLIAFFKSDSNITGRIDDICQLAGSGEAVLNATHLCQSMAYDSAKVMNFSGFSLFIEKNPVVNAEVLPERFFSIKHVFVLESEGDKLDYEYGDETLKIKSIKVRFSFGRSKNSFNYLGMNFLDHKTITVDYFVSKIRISQCPGGFADCDSQTISSNSSSLRAMRIGVDILVFVLFISVIFGSIISFDKFVNEDEYMKEA